MFRMPSFRAMVVAAVCLFGIGALLPNFFSRATLDSMPGWMPSRQITLGLDLQGGSYLLLEVDLGPIFHERLETLVNDLRVSLRGARVNYRGLGVQGDTVNVTLVDPGQRDQAQAEIQKLNPLSLGATGQIRDFDVQEDNGAVRAPALRGQAQ